MGLDTFSLEEQTIVITGASSGIGRAVAVAAVSLKAKVVLIGRDEDGLRQTVALCADTDCTLIHQADITNYESLESIAKTTLEYFGRISGFVHCAGLQKTVPLRAMKPRVYEETFSVNVIAGLELARIFSKKKYLSTEGASFIFTSSVMGFRGEPSLAAYAASKGALLSATKALAVELSPKKVRVNSVCPGYVKNTKMSKFVFGTLPESSVNEIESKHCLGTGTPDDVAYPIMFLLSAASGWITGTGMVIDGGYSAH